MTKSRSKQEVYHFETEIDRIRIMEELDSPMIVADSGMIIDYDESLYEELDNIPIIARLRNVKQLGLVGNCSDFVRTSETANHSRHWHSLVMATKLDHVAGLLGLDRNLIVSGCMFHDVATPPFSDSVSKALGLDDQECFEYVLDSCPAALRFLERRGISKRTLCGIIAGTDSSPIGQLVSSKGSIDGDRWSYVIEDAINSGQVNESLGSRYLPDPFKAVKIVDGKVVFLDVAEVQRFLEARAYMIERVYLTDKLKAKEAFFGKMLREMRSRRIIKDEELFSMSEDDLRRRCMHYDRELTEQIFLLDGFALYDRFHASPEELRRFLSRETKRPFVVDRGHPPNPAVDTPILHHGKATPYHQLEPFHTTLLRRRLDCFNSTAVYGLEDDKGLEVAVRKARTRFRLYQISHQPIMDYVRMTEREMRK